MRFHLIIVLCALAVACSKPPPPAVVALPDMGPVDFGVEEETHQITIRETSGLVERRKGEAWEAASPGDLLGADESIRTGDDGRVTLGVGEEADVVLQNASEVVVEEVSKAVAQLKLQRGRVGAQLKSKKMKLRIASEGSKVVAEATQEGEFAVFNSGRGLVAVVAKSSGVRVETAAGTKELEVGQVANVQGDKPADVTAFPSTVYLKVAWPEERLTRAKTTTIRGKADIGTSVVVNGKAAVLSQDGAFVVEVPLEEGRNALAVVATDVMGRQVEEAIAVRARRKPPRVDANTEGLWK